MRIVTSLKTVFGDIIQWNFPELINLINMTYLIQAGRINHHHLNSYIIHHTYK